MSRFDGEFFSSSSALEKRRDIFFPASLYPPRLLRINCILYSLKIALRLDKFLGIFQCEICIGKLAVDKSANANIIIAAANHYTVSRGRDIAAAAAP